MSPRSSRSLASTTRARSGLKLTFARRLLEYRGRAFELRQSIAREVHSVDPAVDERFGGVRETSSAGGEPHPHVEVLSSPQCFVEEAGGNERRAFDDD